MKTMKKKNNRSQETKPCPYCSPVKMLKRMGWAPHIAAMHREKDMPKWDLASHATLQSKEIAETLLVSAVSERSEATSQSGLTTRRLLEKMISDLDEKRAALAIPELEVQLEKLRVQASDISRHRDALSQAVEKLSTEDPK